MDTTAVRHLRSIGTARDTIPVPAADPRHRRTPDSRRLRPRRGLRTGIRADAPRCPRAAEPRTPTGTPGRSHAPAAVPVHLTSDREPPRPAPPARARPGPRGRS
ncbi:hypothetical protein ACFWWS_33090, partial [Streptomyces sp. NPDC059083]